MLRIPRYSIPVPLRTSPFAAEANTAAAGYLRRAGLLRSDAAARHYELSRFGDMVGRMYPDADRSDLVLIAQWMAVWAMFDDQLEELPDRHDVSERQFHALVRTVLSWLPVEADTAPPAPGSAPDPFGPAFADLWRRIGGRTSPAWRRRFVRHFEDYLLACRWEAGNRRSGRVPERHSYVVARRRFGGARPALDLMELAWRFDLPDALHHDSRVIATIDAGADLMLWSNDLFSAECDAAEGNVNNLVVIVRHERGGTLQRAARFVAALYEHRLREFLDLRARLPLVYDALRLPERVRADADRYTTGPLVWTRGQHDWSTGNERYRSYRPRTSGGEHNFVAETLCGVSPPSRRSG